MPRRWPLGTTMEDLAAEYVQLVNLEATVEEVRSASADAWDILQEMQRRAGIEHTNTHLNRAREIYKMLTT